MASYVIVITAADGTVSVCGTFQNKIKAEIVASRIESAELSAVVLPAEPPQTVLREVGTARPPKLNDEQQSQLRAEYEARELSAVALARKYGISRATLYRIVSTPDQ